MATSLCVGPLQENCYLIDDGEGGWIVVDPGAEAGRIQQALGDRPLRLILITHHHNDHTGAVEELLPLSEQGWMVSKKDYPLLTPDRPDKLNFFAMPPIISQPPARLLEEGDEVSVGKVTLRVIETPGHTPGGIIFIDDARNLAYTGDTLFAGSCGRTDLYGGDPTQMVASLQRLSTLPAQMQIFPGHGPSTVIEHELLTNAPMLAALARKRP